MNPAQHFIQIQQLRDLCWKAHINKDPAKALALAALLESIAAKLKAELSGKSSEDSE